MTTILALACASLAEAQAASAVAVGIDPETDDLRYGYWTGAKLSEKEVQRRAIGVCLLSGCKSARVIASTPQRGCGAVAAFQRGGNKTRFVAILAKPSQQQAVSAAIREAKLQGGRSGKVVQVWCDL